MRYVTYDDLYDIMNGIKNKIGGGGGSSPTTVASAPSYYQREDLPISNKTTLTVKPTWVNIDDGGYILATDKVLDLTLATSWDDSQYTSGTARAGKDFYIYACKPTSGTIPDIVLSHNSTVPTGYTAADSRKIGGFHCLCADVGIISGHTLSGYVAGDILPASIWDLKHRAVSDNEGMVWIPEINKWCDIYLGSWDGTKIVSEYNGVPITGASSTPMHGLLLAENYGKVNKMLPRYDEFIVLAKGSPEGTNIQGSTAPTGAGGHIDTNSIRIVSYYGGEDCTGVIWQWGSDHAENYLASGGNATTYRGSYYTSGNTGLSGYAWNETPVYDANVDTTNMGSASGLLRRFLFGGGWDGGSRCGSRCVFCRAFGSALDSFFAGRGLSCLR